VLFRLEACSRNLFLDFQGSPLFLSLSTVFFSQFFFYHRSFPFIYSTDFFCTGLFEQFSPSAQLPVFHRLESYSSHLGRVLSFPSIGIEVVPDTYTTLVCRAEVLKSWGVLCSFQFIHFRSHFLSRPGLALCMFFPQCVQIERDGVSTEDCGV